MLIESRLKEIAKGETVWWDEAKEMAIKLLAAYWQKLTPKTELEVGQEIRKRWPEHGYWIVREVTDADDSATCLAEGFTEFRKIDILL